MAALVKAPINAVIALINTAISGINGLGLKIPDWVPIIGGKDFRINIPEIPMLARGGFTSGPSIAGEAGREAVISFQSGVRAQNIDTWMQAGRMLGINSIDMSRDNAVELKEIDSGGNDGGGGDRGDGPPVVYAPQITIQGNADRQVVEEALQEAESQFEVWYERMMRRKARTRY